MAERSARGHSDMPSPDLPTRVQLKRQLLRKWLQEGVPHNQIANVPQSLTEARLWHDPEQQIFKIGSPNDFTTKHPLVGADVTAIAGLITKLKEKIKRPQTRRRSAAKLPVISAQEIEQAFAALISQWHKADNDARVQRKRANTAEMHRDIARAEVAEKDKQIAELLRRLNGGLSVVQ